MANLNGQNIGTNYKGILNLNTLNSNLSGTLQAVTDGDGNASALQLSTQKAVITGANSQVALTIIGAAGANIQEWGFSAAIKAYLKDNGSLILNADNAFSSINVPLLGTSNTNTGIGSPNPNQISLILYGNEAARFIYGDGIGKYANPNNTCWYGVLANGDLNITVKSGQNVNLNNLRSSRPSTVGQLYQDTAANILANGDLVVGIRV
jgi:hypothetical protein